MNRIAFIALLYCAIAQAGVAQGLSYLALGDSYTIGESIDESQRFPEQLVDTLAGYGIALSEPWVVAETGWTTGDLLHGLDTARLKPPYDLVTLLIGVNNQYEGLSLNNYKTEFERLLKKSIDYAGDDSNAVFVISFPDYGVTPFGRKKAKKIARETDEFNEAQKRITQSFGITFINITPISRRLADSPGVLADDRLHPSAKQYAHWVTLISDSIRSGMNRPKMKMKQ